MTLTFSYTNRVKEKRRIMTFNPILRVPKGKEGTLDPSKILNYFHGLGWRTTPVKNQYQKYWITHKMDMSLDPPQKLELISGSKYYKLVIDSTEFGIECGGDLNGWQFAAEIREAIKSQ